MARQTPPAPPSPCLPAAAVTHGSGHHPTHWALHLPSFQAEVLRSRTPRLSDAALPPTHPPTSTRPPSHADHMLATPTSSQVRGRAPLVNACAGHRSEGSTSAPPSSASRGPQRSPTERISATCGTAAAQAAGCQRAVRWKLRLASPVAPSPWCARGRAGQEQCGEHLQGRSSVAINVPGARPSSPRYGCRADRWKRASGLLRCLRGARQRRPPRSR